MQKVHKKSSVVARNEQSPRIPASPESQGARTGKMSAAVEGSLKLLDSL